MAAILKNTKQTSQVPPVQFNRNLVGMAMDASQQSVATFRSDRELNMAGMVAILRHDCAIIRFVSDMHFKLLLKFHLWDLVETCQE